MVTHEFKSEKEFIDFITGKGFWIEEVETPIINYRKFRLFDGFKLKHICFVKEE